MKNIDFYHQGVDPDKDFSYIDKKIEDVLGHHQKDFMGGLCPDILGATVGGYGSFLPMKQRSASVLSGEKTQRNSSQNLPTKLSHQKTVMVANHSLPIKPVPKSSDYTLKKPSDDNQFKNPAIDHSKKNLLKFRVKVPSENFLLSNNSASCSRLVCDTSMSSSLEDSCCRGTPLDMEERKPESPSSIIEVMTTIPLPRDEILSPLHHSLVCLTEKVNNLGIGGLGCSQIHNVDNIHGNTSSGRQREVHNDKDSKVKDPSRDRKSKHKEPIQCSNPTKLFRETPKLPARTSVSSVTGRKGSGASGIGVLDASNAEISRIHASLEHSLLKDEVKEEVLGPSCSKKDTVSSKGGGIGQMGSKGKEVGSVWVKSVKENCAYADTNVGMKNICVRTVEPLKQKANSKATSHSHSAAGTLTRKECSSLTVMKKFRKNQGDGIPTAAPPKGSVAGSASTETKAAKCNNSSKSQMDTNDFHGKVRKNYHLSSDEGPIKKGKGVSSIGFQTAVSERPTHTCPSKPEEKSSITKKGVVSNIGSNMERNMAGGNNVTELMTVPLDNWVQCDKCEKWRLLPMGVETESLPKEWTCSMLTWLPGKNKCSVSEEETNETLRALYEPVLPVPNGTVLVGASVGPQHVDLSTKSDAITNGGKRRNLVKRQVDVARCSGINQKRYNDISKSMDQYKLDRDIVDVRKSGDSKPMKNVKKRAANPELSVSEAPKKMKETHPQSTENMNLANQIEFRDEKQSYDPCALNSPRDYSKRSLKLPLTKVKNNTQAANSVRDSQQKGIFGKKRKSDQNTDVYSSEEHYGQVPSKNLVKVSNGGTELNEEKKEKKLKTSNVQGKEPTIDKALDSSSSNISFKFKRNSGEIKFSPVGSVSSSSFKISMTDDDKGINKMSASCNKLDEFLSVNQVKCEEEDAFNDFSPHSEKIIVRKSNLSRSSGAVSNDALVRKRPEGKDRGVYQIDNQTNSKVGYKDECKKENHEFKGGRSLTLQQNLVPRNHVIRSSNKLHFSDTNSGRESGSSTMNANVLKPKHSQVGDVHACLRHVYVEASNTKKGSSHFAANTALMEATHLKDSADHLKISGSTLQSTEVLFEAALKFLHGASLLESGNHGSGSRYEEMKSIEAYSTTAALCEYCAQEYKKHNNFAFSALAYKCMEVAYMRVVYCSNHRATGDCTELKTAISLAPPVESPPSSSSSASDIDNLSNQSARGTVKNGHTVLDHRIHVISAGNRPKFLQLLNFTEKINQAMEAARMSQEAFASANPVLAHAGNDKGISSIKSVIDFSFHDVDGLLHLVHLAMKALKN